MTFRVVCGRDRPLRFEQPRDIVRASVPSEVPSFFAGIEGALRSGRWIAGYLSYELGVALAGEPVRRTAWPLAAIGVYDEPEGGIGNDPDPSFGLSPMHPRVPFDEFERSIRSLQRSIYDGDAYQVNYTVPFDLAATGDRFALWWHLARETRAPYQAFVDDEGRQILSWSPELFLRFRGSRLETRPMKGTCAPGAEHELQIPKNRAEHVMIVDLLRNDFHRICDDVTVERPFEIERYPTFSTMTTTVAGRLRHNVTLERLFRATFPCGSITGAPKRAAMQRIADLERFPRNAYCGSVGYLSPQMTGWWNVAIRTAQFDGAPFGRFDAGGGIVADSSASGEWAEIAVKSAFLRNAAMAPSAPAILETFAADAGDEVIALHMDRLARTLTAFGVSVSREAVLQAVRAARGLPGSIVRLRVSFDGTPAVTAEPADAQRQPVSICLAGERVYSTDPFLRWKTSWRPHYERAARDASARACFDAILQNERGELTEGSRTTLFVARDGVLLTPRLDCGVLPGILRQRLLQAGRAREAVIGVDDLRSAGDVFVGNSARGLLRAVVV